jgi:hypothetical protein
MAMERQALVKRIKRLQPDVSNRQIARMLGVDESTVRKDLAGNPALTGAKAAAPGAVEGLGRSDLAANAASRRKNTYNDNALEQLSAAFASLGREQSVAVLHHYENPHKPSMVACCKDLLAAIKTDPAAFAAALGRARHTRVS